MALTRCPDCEHEVSDSAEACPKCGRPMGSGTLTRNRGCADLVLLLVVLGMLAVATCTLMGK